MTNGTGQSGGTMRPSGENGLGIAGFICSLLGLISCGLLSPVGLLLSLFAMRREPRGFAIAGLVLGLVAVCGWAIGIVMFGTVIAMALAAVGLGGLAVAMGGAQIEAGLELSNIDREIQVYRDRTGQLPASLDLLPASEPEAMIDPWGRRYEFRLSDDGATYTLFSTGPDGLPGTTDDVQPWEGFSPGQSTTGGGSSTP